MLKKTIKFTDYNDQEREEDFYFNLSKPEMIQMQTSMPEGMDKHLTKLITLNDGNAMIRFFADIVLKSIGERTLNGGFRKTKEYTNAFEESKAYEVLLMELMEDSDATVNFFKSIMPKDLVEKANPPPKH